MKSTFKDFIANAFEKNPLRYGNDNGDINIVNDYFITQDWDLLTREQFSAIATLVRMRNYFLHENKNYDMRQSNTAYEHAGQRTIYDYMDGETAKQSKVLTRYFKGDVNRIRQPNAIIQRILIGVDDKHITTAKIMYPLLATNPKLKDKRIKRKAFCGDMDGDFTGVADV